MYVCICKGVTLKTIREVVAQGASTVDEVERRCGAGGDCGSCRDAIAEIIIDVKATPAARPCCGRGCRDRDLPAFAPALAAVG
jgi:bacterioferritin-associated ferredoxin